MIYTKEPEYTVCYRRGDFVSTQSLDGVIDNCVSFTPAIKPSHMTGVGGDTPVHLHETQYAGSDYT